MPTPKRKTRQARKTAVHPWRPGDRSTGYVHGETGAVRPEPHHTYVLDGVVHRFDGKCHPDCPNVR